jgi:hypothetical protein
MMTKVFTALVALSFAAPAAAETETERAVTSLYERFVAAQNARDTKAVRADVGFAEFRLDQRRQGVLGR